MPRRVYTGSEPAVFVTGGIGHAGPGDAIDVPAALLERFDRRPDITVPAGDPGAGAAEAVPGTEDAGARASRRRPGGRQSGGATAAEEQQEAAP